MKGQKIQILSTATVVAGAKTGTTDQANAGSASIPAKALIRVPTGALTVYFGGSNVDTNANGVPLVAGEDLMIDTVNEIVFAVISSATTSQTVYVLRSGD